MKIGFILNHYNAHQVPHLVPYAFSLSKLRPDIEVTIYSSTDAEEIFARNIGKSYEGHSTKFVRLHIPRWAKLLDPMLRSFVFIRKQAALSANAESLSKLDAIIAPEMTTLGLRKHADFTKTKFIRSGHGAGDNRHGGAFNERIGQFDLALMPGRKYAKGLQDIGYLPEDRYAISGYVKLEAMAKAGGQRLKLFKNDRPVVLYSPHHNRALTSWHKQGADILDYFYGQSEYNLIFAPHVLLFQRAWSKGARLPSKYKSTDNTIIDKGSERSIDMTYLRSADVFVSDITSQFYEFLESPRPAVFVDAHNTSWENDPSYGHWHLGEVSRNVSELGAVIARAIANHPTVKPKQIAAFNHTFDIADEPASLRGARIIAEFVEKGTVSAAYKL